MDSQGELPSSVSTKNKGFSLSALGARGIPSPSLTHRESHLHSSVDPASLIHRTHAFSYSPKSPAKHPSQPPSSSQPALERNSGNREGDIRVTLVTAEGKPPRRGRRRSSLFGVNAEQPPKQLQVSQVQVLTSSSPSSISISYPDEHGSLSRGQRSPRRYSAAQGSLDDMSQDTALLLQKTYSANASSQDGDFPLPSSSDTGRDSQSLTWGSYGPGQAAVVSSAMPTSGLSGNVLDGIRHEKSPILSAIADVPGLSAVVPVHHAGHLNTTTDMDTNSLLTETPTKVLAFPSSPLLNARKTLSLNDHAVDPAAKTGNVLSAINNSSMFSILRGGHKAVGSNDQNSLRPSGNITKEDGTLVETRSQNMALASKFADTDASTEFSADSTDYSSAAHSAEIDSGPFGDAEREDNHGSGLFNWAWNIGAWLGTAPDAGSADVSKKDINMIAPSSF